MNREALWAEVAAAVGGRMYTDNDGFAVDTPVEGGAWRVTLDDVTTTVLVNNVPIPITYLRGRALLTSRDGLRLHVYRANPFTGVAKLFGMQDLTVGGDETFDRSFVVKASAPEQAQRLLGGEAGARLRSLLAALPDPNLSLSDDGRKHAAGGKLPEGVDLLYTFSGGVRTVDDVALLYHLLAETLRGLARIGSASTEEPVVGV